MKIKELREEKDKLKKLILSEEFQAYSKKQRVEVVKKFNKLSRRILKEEIRE